MLLPSISRVKILLIFIVTRKSPKLASQSASLFSRLQQVLRQEKYVNLFARMPRLNPSSCHLFVS